MKLCSSYMVSTIIFIYIVSKTEHHFFEQTSPIDKTSPSYENTSLPVLTSSYENTSSPVLTSSSYENTSLPVLTSSSYENTSSAVLTSSSYENTSPTDLTSTSYKNTLPPVPTSPSEPKTSPQYQISPTHGSPTPNNNKSQSTEMTSALTLHPVQQTTPYSLITTSNNSISSTTDIFCKEVEMDLVIMLDTSGTLNSNNTLKFVKSIVDKTDADTGAVRIGLLKYHRKAKVIFRLNQFNGSVEMKARISRVVFDSNLLMNPATGIGLAVSYMFQSENGDRPGVNNVLIIITGGPPNMYTKKAVLYATKAKAAKIRIITVGLQNYTEMADMSSKPLKDNQFIADDFDDLPDFGNTFIVSSSLCKPQNISLEPVEVKPRVCRCPCSDVGDPSIVNISMAQLEQAIAQLKSQLTVNKTSLTLNIYKKKSAPDSRTSSLGIGIVGAVLLTVPIFLLLILDFITLHQYLAQ